MARVGLDTAAVVSAAARLADAEGPERLTLARLARDLGVRPPSLYEHVSGLDDLRARLAAHGAWQLHAVLAEAVAGRAGADALAALADAYRDFAHDHPGSYAAIQRARDPTDLDGVRAGDAVIDVVAAVLRGYGLDGEDAIHAVRLIRCTLHGFVSLESEGGFGIPLSLDDTWARLVAMVGRGLASRP